MKFSGTVPLWLVLVAGGSSPVSSSPFSFDYYINENKRNMELSKLYITKMSKFKVSLRGTVDSKKIFVCIRTVIVDKFYKSENFDH